MGFARFEKVDPYMDIDTETMAPTEYVSWR